MLAFLSALWAALPWVAITLLAFVGRDMLRRIEALENTVADYIDVFVPNDTFDVADSVRFVPDEAPEP